MKNIGAIRQSIEQYSFFLIMKIYNVKDVQCKVNKFDQGTIVYGLRSEKYPDIRCYGIIISASCDIANCKVSKFYYLSAVNVKEWILSSVGFSEIFNDKLTQCEKSIASIIERNQLDWETLKTFSTKDAEKVISAQCKKPKDVLKAYNDYINFCDQILSKEGKKEIAKANKKNIINYLKKVSKGEIIHFYFLPESAYEKNDVKDNGLVVDLQEIETLSVQDAEMLKKSGIDYMELPEEQKERERLTKQYWLNTNNDFAIILNSIDSPWREHLMQRFSNGFIRIGIDGATEEDFQKIAIYE